MTILALLKSEFDQISLCLDNLKRSHQFNEEATTLADSVVEDLLMAFQQATEALATLEVAEPLLMGQGNSLWKLVEIDPNPNKTIPHVISTETASNIDLPEDKVWVRSDLYGAPIVAHIYSSDLARTRTIDIRPWLESADTNVINHLSEFGWQFCQNAADVALRLKELGDPAATAVLAYTDDCPIDLNGKAVSYDLKIRSDTEAILEWLADNRHDVIPQTPHMGM
jgi:hypothetical protein